MSEQEVKELTPEQEAEKDLLEKAEFNVKYHSQELATAIHALKVIKAGIKSVK